MLLILRFIIALIYLTIICIFGSIWCLCFPRNPQHVATFSHMFGRLSIVFGIRVKLRKPVNVTNYGNAIYIANHQNNYDIIIAANIVQPTTVTVGKKSLLWIPLFGQLYWLTGNIVIDRNNRINAYNTINEIINKFHKKRISFWIFPEGTRSRGKGLLPFKTGAFHVAIAAKVPIIPIVISNTHNKIKLNRWNNGIVIIEMMPPVYPSNFKSITVKKLTNYCHTLMALKIQELNNEVTKLKKTSIR
ncbi:1-acylglycerol-3-phosphate O-acyltransferase [Pantoea sp. Aalb]|uniref:1-acylglycerol-3-phosphate O-acyltransferase n=1 Tax=Pantoea sp. Aalb TaxID=2576762 RepID=UPI00132AFF9B|nr:1-acylglycerol-3-phosphate O-acyltransferase [Pantoea sp. Aalb]MXP67708.1 1-acylglycerol-3-phosphate O-acyltransferase [Pantoea sp. Aalb]